MARSIALPSLSTLALFLVLTATTTTTFNPSLVHACGVTIHNEVAFRASRILLSAKQDNDNSTRLVTPPHQTHSHAPSYSHSLVHLNTNHTFTSTSLQDDYTPLLEQRDLLLAGSFFPDWGYNCIGKLYNEAAEEAHWPPFAEAAVRYILETYPKPWDDHTKQLITFLFGTVSHSLGDMSWHALRGLTSGFIGALADTSFGGDYSKGHTLADIGAEFVLGHMGEIDHLITSWKVPVKDITEIYKRMGYRVPGPVLSHCMRNGFAGIQANARLGSQLFPIYAPQSPFLVEQIEDYPMGGLRDMTEWTVDCWHGLAQYLDEERPLPDLIDPIGTNTTFNLCYALWEERTKTYHRDALEYARDGQVRYGHAAVEGAKALSRLKQAGLKVQTASDSKSGMVTFSIESIPNNGDDVYANGTTEELDLDDTMALGQQQHHQQQQKQEGEGQQPHSRKLAKVEAIKMTGSRVNACLTFSDEFDSQVKTLFLPIAYSSFGQAAVTGDFDGDGILDLAIAAPHATFDPRAPSQGSVFIIPGQSLYNDDDDNDDMQDDPVKGTDVRTLASHVLHGDPFEPQSRFGWSLAVVDLNEDGIDDLAIGAPGHGTKDLVYGGSVFVYFGRRGLGFNNTPDLIIHHDRTKDRALDVPQGVSALAGLGYVVEGLDLTGSGFKDLVAGMPMAYGIVPTKPSNETKPPLELARQTGKVVAFLASTRHNGSIFDIDRDWELQGDAKFAWFGSSIAVVTEAFLQAVPSTPPKWSWLVPSWFDRKGHKDKKEQVELKERRILVVGSPTFGGDEEQEFMRGHIQGFLLPNDTVTTPPTKPPIKPLKPQWMFTILGDTKFQQLGSRLAAANHSSSTSPSGFKNMLIVGSQSEDVLNKLPKIGRQWQAGMVRILDISQIANGTIVNMSDLDDDTNVVRDSLQGSQSMAHLSAAIEVSTDGKSLWLAEPYAKGETGRILEWEPNYSRRDDDDDDDDSDGHRRRRHGQKEDVVDVRGQQLVFSNDIQKDGDSDGGDRDDDDGGNDGDRIKQCFVGSDFRGRFGSQLLVADLNKDDVDDIIVTSSHSSQYANMAGTVTIRFRL
ncbi:Glycosylphosphatidylinositol specific phospholipase D1 [Linnemannia gamsii]|uniref:Phosphatidylinositol-glycan-specific phospholipase D n=1 Tax=Linnemannia gamsii TaxID=64522 RepID=A0ABQ7JRW8_9FUNG|nr:Glycosylphosphatidylinositol specific phospholipase D1 [Linnemannia gamsii]